MGGHAMTWLLLLPLRVFTAIARAVDNALADLGTDGHDANDCEACHMANDPVMQRFDLNLWAMEMQERQP